MRSHGALLQLPLRAAGMFCWLQAGLRLCRQRTGITLRNTNGEEALPRPLSTAKNSVIKTKPQTATNVLI